MRKPFTVNCLWLGADGGLVWAVTGEAALLSFLLSHGYGQKDLLGELTHYPPEPDDDDFLDEWSVTIKGQEWVNGDCNYETVSVYSAEVEDVAIPC